MRIAVDDSEATHRQQWPEAVPLTRPLAGHDLKRWVESN